MGDDFVDKVSALSYGDVTDFTNFGGAVIDERAFDRNAAAHGPGQGARRA